MSTSPTYIYKDYRKNFIIDIPLLERVKKLKVESWRLGNERSEDALSWNCFLGLHRLGGLASAVQALAGIDAGDDIELYLWGVRISEGAPSVWGRLLEVRQILEHGAGIPTEPDIILRVPGRAIILIEAKFGSPNSSMQGHEERFGGVGEFLDRYPGVEGAIDPLNREWIKDQPAGVILQQLVRNVIFAQWLAGEGEEPHVVNLVRGCDERDVAERFVPHLADDGSVRFRRWTWEDLYRLPTLGRDDAGPLGDYLRNKTNKLVKAFDC